MDKHQGFTLVEVIVVTMIIAIIATIAVPSFITQFKRFEATNTQNKNTATLKAAKAESRIRHQNLIVCLVNATNVCDKNAQDKLLLFTDSDNNHMFNDNVDTLIKTTTLDLHYGKVYLRAGGRMHTKFLSDTGMPPTWAYGTYQILPK